MSTPEHAAASLEVRVRDAMEPLREAAGRLWVLAADLDRAARTGDTARVIEVADQLLTDGTGFRQVFRDWQRTRPDAPVWRPDGSDGADRMST
jgi:hypothetical protein